MIGVAASKTLTGHGASKLLKHTQLLRQLEDEAQQQQQEEQDGQDGEGDGDGEEEDEFGFLTQYSLKFVSCSDKERIINPESGEYEYGVVHVRLCESSDCNNNNNKGCKSRYGDILVSASTFLDAWLEEQRNNDDEDDGEEEDDDEFDLGKYAQCERYELENGDDDDAAVNDDDDQDDNDAYYYIGPACTKDGKDIALALYSDEYCSEKESNMKFTDIAGFQLPYEDGGLIANHQCQVCMGYDEEEDQYELKDYCVKQYENAPYKCEQRMQYVSYYGADTSGCTEIKEYMKSNKELNGGKVFGWFLFVCILRGGWMYVRWWRTRKLLYTV